MSNKIEIEVELLRDLVDASGYVSTFYTMFINHETPENCGDLNATEYLASEASSIAERGRAVLEAAEQSVQADVCNCAEKGYVFVCKDGSEIMSCCGTRR
jgi:hypothetical protein